MSLPATMTYMMLDGHGGPEVLKPATMAVPMPGHGEILIKVAVAGVNRPDVQQRMGQYNPPPGASPIPGLEVAGEVAAVGPGCTRFKVGDKVCALTPGGGYAEYCVTPEPQALPIPKGLSMIEAGAVPETFFTVWTNVFDRARLKPGETLLVHGGSSGIGTTAIQLAKAFGSRVFCTVGGADKAEACVKLGAERAINYKTEDFESALRGDGGVDVILDMVAGPYVQKNLDILNEGGRCVIIAFLLGPTAPQLNIMRVMLKRLTLTGSTLRARPLAEKARLARAVEENVWPWIESGKVKTVVDAVFPLAEAEAAQARMTAGLNAGKIILKP